MILPTSNNDRYFEKYSEITPECVYKLLARVKRLYQARSQALEILNQIAKVELLFQSDS